MAYKLQSLNLACSHYVLPLAVLSQIHTAAWCRDEGTWNQDVEVGDHLAKKSIVKQEGIGTVGDGESGIILQGR